MRTNFFAFTTTRPVAITMVVIAVVVFGLVSYQRLSLNLMPEISYPTMTVRTEYPGTAPEEVETTVSRPVEQALGVVSGLVSISSISKAGVSDVVLEFDWDTDLDEAMTQAREKLDRLYFPDEVKRPMILRYDPSLDPIVRLALYGGDDLYQLRLLAEQEVERALEKLPGVAAVRVKGGLEEEVVIELEEGKLAALNIGLERVASRLGEENVNMAGGILREGDTQFLVRTLNEFKTLDEIAALVVEEKSGTPIRISDLGRVYRGHKEREVITRVGGQESVEIEIYKEADANVVTVAADIANLLYGTAEQRQYVEKMNGEPAGEGDQGKKDYAKDKRMTYFVAHELPAPVELRTLFNQSVFIKNSIDEVRNTAIIGGLLAVIVLFLFLNSVPSTLIISLSIPISIIATFAPMYLFGVSLNIMSLGGLALGVGMLVDSSIVVLESIYRCRQEGDDPVRSAVRGTGEVGGAVLASTLTTVAVFFPIVFVEGIAGQIFGDMALTVVFSLLASLLVALFVIPMLASRRIGGTDGSAREAAVRSLLKPSLGANLAALKAGISSRKGFGSKSAVAFSGWFKIFFLEIWSVLYKPLLGLASLLIALLKGVLLLAAAVPFWVAALFFGKPAQKLETFAADGRLVGRAWLSGFCPGLFAFKSPELAAASASRLRGRLATGSRLSRAAKWTFFFLPASLYFAIRLIAGLSLEVLAKALVAAGLVLALAATGVVSVAVTLLLPVVLPSVAGFNIVYSRVEEFYPRLVTWALNNRLAVASASLALFLYCAYGVFPRLGRELIPEVHQGEFIVQAQLPVGTPLTRTDNYLRALE
ncbi:MAG TPA: efflux RND transporter permease subunit, partial [Candidatus Glassbacteria bacterium]|nr:efflux RND transporter permease subunit [Candidatus Glassbacteria bacterium]